MNGTDLSESHFGTNNRAGIKIMNQEREMLMLSGEELPEDDFVLPDTLSEKNRGRITDDKRYAVYRQKIAAAVRENLLMVEHRNFDQNTKMELLFHFGIIIVRKEREIEEGKIPASVCELLGEEGKDSYVSIEGTKVMIIPLEKMSNYKRNLTIIDPNKKVLPQLHIGQPGNRLLKSRHGVIVPDFFENYMIGGRANS